MPYRSRGFALRPVNRIKHVVDKQSAVTAGTTENTALIDAKDSPALANTEEVLTGSTINAIYLKVETNATTSAALANCYMFVGKSPGNNITFPAPNVVGASDNKRFVIHQEMIMFQQQDGSNPRTLFNGVIKIPKGYKRFGPDDALIFSILAPGVNIQYCFQCHYKEFR